MAGRRVGFAPRVARWALAAIGALTLASVASQDYAPIASPVQELTSMCVNKASQRVRWASSVAACSSRTETALSLPAGAPIHLCVYPPDNYVRRTLTPGACAAGETPLTMPATGPLFFCYNSSTGYYLRSVGAPNLCTGTDVAVAVSVPVAMDDVYAPLEDLTLNATTVLANDTDAHLDPLTAQLATGPASASSFALNADGTFSYKGAADFCGTDSFTYRATDGTYQSTPATVTLNVTCVNDAPSYTVGPDQAVFDDAGAQTVVGWATGMSPGPADEAGQTLTFTVTGNTNPGILDVAPAVNASTGTLTFTPKPGASGTTTITLELKDNGGTANGGVDAVSHTFTITVTPANQPPIANDDGPYTVAEDSPLTVVAPGVLGNDVDPDAGGSVAAAALVTGPANAAAFTLNGNGSFSYTPNPNYCGPDSFTYNAQDNTGALSLTAATVSISVTCVNDAPSFAKGPNQTVLEDAGPQTVNPWATAISAGPPNEAGQTLSFNVTGNTNPALFAAGPAISPTGTLTYTPAANAFGSATVTVVLMDNGGTANGGVDTSPPQSFVITVNPVNDAPSFTKGPDQTVEEDSGPHTVNPWATAISIGPPNEAGQTLTFNVTGNTNPALFSAGPSVSPTGVLSYSLTANASGAATITLVLMDNGGTANGGVDTSPAQSFTITVNPVNDAPVALDKAHNVTGNIQINVPAASGLNVGVTDVENDTLSAQLDGSSAHTGEVVINADGSYSYNPKAGFEGVDTVKFKVCDNGTPAPACSAVKSLTLTISGMVWFIDNSKAAAGDGRLTAPFNTLAGFEAVNGAGGDNPAAGDNIFIDRLVATNYTGPVTLENNQKLFGKGATAPLFGGGGLTGLTLAPDSITVPSTSGTAPIISSPSGSNGIVLAQSNTIRGLTVSSTPNATGVTGSNFLTLSMTEAAIGGAGRTGAALSLTNGSATVVLTETTSTSSAGSSVVLSSVDGTLNLGTGTLTGWTTSGFSVLGAGGSATISYGGDIGSTSGTAVSINAKDAGIVTLTGAISHSGGPGIVLSSNAGATITIGGAVTLSTGTSSAFSATAGGTVNVTGSTNTLATTTGVALNIANTTIGASGVNFRSVSAGTAATGPTNGIVLNNTGSTGGLTVAGVGTNIGASGGGVIQRTTGDAISLTSTRNVSLNGLSVSNTGRHGIFGTGVTNLTVSNSNFVNIGDANEEDGMYFRTEGANNITGTLTLTNVHLENFFENGVGIKNNAGQLTVNVTDSEFVNNDDTFGESGILAQATDTAGINLNVSTSQFDNIEAAAIRWLCDGTGTFDANILNNTITNQGGPNNFPTTENIVVSTRDQNTVTFDIKGNQMTGVVGDGIVVVGDGNVQGRIGGATVAEGNTITGETGVALGDGVRLDMDGVFGGVINSANFTWTVLIKNNTINMGGSGDDGIQVLNRDHVGTMNLTVENNGIQSTLSEGFRYFAGERNSPPLGDTNGKVRLANNVFTNTSTGGGEFDIVVRTTDSAIVCVDITGNSRVPAATFDIDFQEAETSTITITQNNLATLRNANGGSPNTNVSNSEGTVSGPVACAVPLPTHS